MKLHTIIAERFVEEIMTSIRNGTPTCPWQKNWKGAKENYVSGHKYSGINQFLLPDGYFLTFNQFKKLKERIPELKLKKGSKSFFAIYWNVKHENDDPESPVETVFPVYHNIFKADDFENLPPKVSNAFANISENKTEIWNNFIENFTSCEITEIMGNSTCSFSPRTNKIVAPTKETFYFEDEYYLALAHEIIHAKGFELGEYEASSNEKEEYSYEEMVASMGAYILLAELGININPLAKQNEVSYCCGWARYFQEHPHQIIRAATRAQKRVDALLGRTVENNDSEETLVPAL